MIGSPPPEAGLRLLRGSSRTVISNTNLVTRGDGQNKQPSAHATGRAPMHASMPVPCFVKPVFLGWPTAARKIESSSLQFGLVQIRRISVLRGRMCRVLKEMPGMGQLRNIGCAARGPKHGPSHQRILLPGGAREAGNSPTQPQ